MEKVIWSCNDYSIFRVGTDRLHDIARLDPILREDDSYMIAETDSHLLRVMNALGIETRQIGNPLIYLASETIPVCSSKKGLTKFYQRCYPLLAAS